MKADKDVRRVLLGTLCGVLLLVQIVLFGGLFVGKYSAVAVSLLVAGSTGLTILMAAGRQIHIGVIVTPSIALSVYLMGTGVSQPSTDYLIFGGVIGAVVSHLPPPFMLFCWFGISSLPFASALSGHGELAVMIASAWFGLVLGWLLRPSSNDRRQASP